MKNYKKYKPYIRRMNGKEKANDLFTAYRLAFYQELYLKKGNKCFVMVQRGFPNLAIAVGASRKDVKKSIFIICAKRISFKKWTTETKRYANKKYYDKKKALVI